MMQFQGETGRKGVRLMFYLVIKEGDKTPIVCCEFADTQPCLTGKSQHHPILYRAWRKPKGTMGCWVIFEYNGKDNVPDLSLPIPVFKLPRGSEKMTEEEVCAYWHSE